MEALTAESPSPTSTLLRRWREAGRAAHLAECTALRNSLDYCRSGAALDGNLAAAAAKLRNVANEARRDALHAANFAEPVLSLDHDE